MLVLRRFPEKGWGMGVCAGIAYYFGVPAFLVRCLFLVLSKYSALVYLLLWVTIPEEKAPADFNARTG